ncbi:hypothetical protein V8C34DRAFT_291696 [Trichoderma compactum]
MPNPPGCDSIHNIISMDSLFYTASVPTTALYIYVQYQSAIQLASSAKDDLLGFNAQIPQLIIIIIIITIIASYTFLSPSGSPVCHPSNALAHRSSNTSRPIRSATASPSQPSQLSTPHRPN